MLSKSLVFKSQKEDFFKIFFFTFLVFVISFNPVFLSSTLVILATVYLLDGGHVYSTLLEVYADPEEIRKGYVWVVTFLSLVLNLLVLIFLPNYFFYYIFYFTVFHNMRQGLGVTFLYRKGIKGYAQFYKYSYYFLTVVPFLLFHFRVRDSKVKLGDAIIKSFDLSAFYSSEILAKYFQFGVIFFGIGGALILAYIYFKKQFQGLFSLIFFSFVYVFAFLISKNEFQSYIILIVSHAVPYYFLMEKRLVNTHRYNVIKKFAYMFLFFSFLAGGTLDYFHDSIIEYFDDADVLIRAILTTPLIAHFIFDGLIWRRGNERFKVFLQK